VGGNRPYLFPAKRDTWINWDSISRFWCGLTHRSVTWPRSGKYQCRICGRYYAVPWAGQAHANVVPFESRGVRGRMVASASERPRSCA